MDIKKIVDELPDSNPLVDATLGGFQVGYEIGKEQREQAENHNRDMLDFDRQRREEMAAEAEEFDMPDVPGL